MLQSSTKKTVHANYVLFLLGLSLLLTSCSGSATPTSDHPPSELPTKSSDVQVTDVSASIPNLSAGQHLRFERISLEQGLSQSTVFSMLQDSQGFMWFGTEAGLNKYDGYTFTVYRHDPEDPNSLGGNWIQSMLEDDSGTLWIGISEGGLDRYDRELDQFTHYRNDPQDPSSLSDNEITAIYQDRDGVLWIGTGGGGLNRLVPSASSGQALSQTLSEVEGEAEGPDLEKERFVHYQHNPDDPNSLSSNAVSVIYQDREGVLWVGTEDGGLNRLALSQTLSGAEGEVEGFDSENERWWHYVNDPSDPHSLSHNSRTASPEDQSGAIWVGTSSGGLNKLDQENERFIRYQHDPDDPESLSSDQITAIFQDREDVLWIGTYSGGLNRFVPEKETFAHYQNVPGDRHSLSNNIVVSIFQDREGMLWFGTIGGGVNKLNMGWRNFTLYQNDPDDTNSLGDNMVRAFYQDSDAALWIGTMFGGLDRFDPETGGWRHFRHDPFDPGSLSDDFVSVVYRDRSDALWIGTASGLDRFEPETGTFTHYQADPDGPVGSPGNNVRTINEGQDGGFWIGTKGGLYRFDRAEESWSHPYQHDPGDPHSLSDDWVFTFLEDREGIIWIGTLGGGLNRFDPETETFTRYQNVPGDPHSLSNNVVVSIVQDQKGALWIGTGGGFDKLDQATETFSHYRERDGLPNASVYCLVEDGHGHLWVSTGKGLSRFDPQSETFRNYDVTDGLQSNEFNSIACLIGDSEEMFFGGINGFNTFFPEHVQDNPTIPPVVLTSLAHDGEEIDLGIAFDSVTELTFKWPDNSFEFEFAALSYAQPEKNQYTYMLEGFDEDWIEIGTRRYGKYTNLPGGTYTLHLRGSNNDGVWNEAGTAVQVTIVPPFWATWWFRGVVLFVVLGSAFGAYRLRVRSLEARSRRLESQVEQRTAELLQTEEALKQSEMEKAITGERNRLARDLHDSVTQSLFSLTLFTQAALERAEVGDLDPVKQSLARIADTARTGLKEMRLLVYELRPLALEDQGLVGALRQRLEMVEGRSGVQTRLLVEPQGEVELPAAMEKELYRITQEALNNTLKHANASSITVRLAITPSAMNPDDRHLELEVSDDGGGLDPQAVADKGGLGLTSIRERVEGLGGELNVISSPGQGTALKVNVNLSDTEKTE